MGDALLICGPEYARGSAGALKNALDWLVSGDELPGEPTARAKVDQARALKAEGESMRAIAEELGVSSAPSTAC